MKREVRFVITTQHVEKLDIYRI